MTLREALVAIHGPEGAAYILTRFFLVDAYPVCEQPCGCKGRCGGRPGDIFGRAFTATVRQWVTELTENNKEQA